jgi:D-aspartate ligase
LPTYKHPVIIIQGTGNGLGIARNLGSIGIDVYCLTSNRLDPTFFSKYCTGFAVVPGVEVDPERLKTALTRLAKQLPQKGVLFPTGDLSVLTLASIIDELDDYLSFVPDREVVETLVVKKKFYESLREHGIPHPLTLNTDGTEVDGLEGKLAPPVFIRPSQTAIFSKLFRRKGFVAHTVGELRRYLQVAAQHNLEVLIQEIVPGPTSNGYTIKGYLDKRSKPVVLFTLQKIRQSTMFTNPSVIKSIPLWDLADFMDVVVHYLQLIKYRGLFGAEIKKDAKTGVFKLLEINARSMGGNFFPTACGVNNILTAYLDIIGEKAPPVKDYAVGVYGINFIRDVNILMRLLVKGHLSHETILPYLRKKFWYTFSMDDPIPFFIDLYNQVSEKYFQ